MITNNSLKKIVLLAVIFLFTGAISLYAQDNLDRGIDAVKKGDYVKALEYLKNAPKDKYEGNLYYGIALFKTGSAAEAEKYLKAAISNDNERPEAYAALGELYTSQKKYSDAAAQFDMARKYLPLNQTADNLSEEERNMVISALTKEAENFIADGKVDKAISSLTMAKTYNDKNPMVYVGLGDAYLARGAYDIAKTNYEAGLKIKTYAPAYYGLGEIAFKKKKYNDALDLYTKATDADNNFAPAFFKKGLILYLADKYDQALDAFKRYAELVPGSLRGNTYYAKTLYKKGDYDESIRLLEEALKTDPNYSEANKYMGYNYAAKKDFAKAEEYFNKVKPEDMNSEDYMVQASMYAGEKDFSKSYPLYEKAIAADTAFEEAYFEYGKALFNDTTYADHYRAALTNFQKAIDLGILNVAAWVYAGIADFYLGDYDKGVAVIDKSIELNPNICSAYLWKANNLAGAKKNPEAIESYKKYLTCQPDDQFAKDQIEKLSKQ
jgi:tetratricopeptide (TPR) repeat protein